MTCLTALLIFLSAHEFRSPALGWVLLDDEAREKEQVYTWIEYQHESKTRIHYFAFGRSPDEFPKLKQTGTCKLQNNKEVPILELDTKLKDLK